jgi:diadenosine tetraphosphate (Ap4A) HIT family hydrolase
MQAPNPCPFCTLPEGRVLYSNDRGKVTRDAFPISPGHTLVIPHRHVRSLFDLSAEEWSALFELLCAAKADVDKEFAPAAYNVGVNDGSMAGQTVPHLHIHLIPRYEGDVPDPRGGVRWLFPERAKYWP